MFSLSPRHAPRARPRHDPHHFSPRDIHVRLLLGVATAAHAQAPKSPIYTPGKLTPAQQIARDAYKEIIEINTSVTADWSPELETLKFIERV